jgi:flagellar hook assembly protein FlgD
VDDARQSGPAVHGHRELGSLILDIEGNRLDAAFLRSTGEVADRFTIVKGSVTSTPGSKSHSITLAALPNPTRGSSTLRFTLPRPEAVRISVHDVAGRMVATVAQGEKPAGAHAVHWDGTSDSGRRASPGVYFVRLRAGETELTARVVREE